MNRWGVFGSTVTLIPAWWLLGLDFIVFHVLALILVVHRPNIVIIRDEFQFVHALLVLFLISSLLVNSLLDGSGLYRFLASANNLSILVVGYIVYSYVVLTGKHEGCSSFGRFAQCALKVAWIYLAVAIVLLSAVFLKGVFELKVPTLFGSLSPDLPGLLGEYQSVWLMRNEWFAGTPVARLYIFAPFATGSALVILITGLLGFSVVYTRTVTGAIAFLILVGIGVSMTLTRASIVGYILALLVIIGFLVSRTWRLLITYSLPLVVSVLVVVMFALTEFILGLREGSSETRLFYYILSIDYVMQHSPIYGVGIKPSSSETYIPLGSHSSILTMFVRGGVIGVTIFLAAFVIIPIVWVIRIWFRLLAMRNMPNHERVSLAAVVAAYVGCLLYMLVGDIDAYPVLAVLIFSVMALLNLCDRYTGIRLRNARTYTGRTGHKQETSC